MMVARPRVPLRTATGWEHDYIKLARRSRLGFKFLARRAAKAVPAGGRLLEVGLGSGYLLAEFALKRPDLEVFGLDISPIMLEYAMGVMSERGLADRVHLELGSAYEMPYPDDTFDYIFCMNTIHGLDEPDRFLREACRVLKPGGQADIRAWRRDAWRAVRAMGGLNTWVLRRTGSRLEGMAPVLAASYTKAELETMLRLLPLSELSVDTGPFSLVARFRK